MVYNYVTNLENCYVDVPLILYYSHIPSALIALFIGGFVLINSKTLAAKILFLISIFFSLWSASDIILWTTYDSRVVMLFWSFINVWEVLISVSTLYFIYTFLNKRDAPFSVKLPVVLLVSIFILFVPTIFNLTQFNSLVCEATQGPLIYYFRFLEGLFSIVLISYLVYKIFKTNKEEKGQFFHLAVGAVTLNILISWINIYGTITERWEITQYSFFGMPIFIGLLAYLIVRYKAFNIKLLGAQVLVIAMVILIGSQFLFIRTRTNQFLTATTLILMIGSGYFLIRSVKRESDRKEELQMMADRLADANQRLKKLDQAKSDFISIASHQLRTPLTSIKGFISLILEGSYGLIPGDVQNILNKVYLSNERLIHLVEDLLNISRIESGRLQFHIEDCDIAELLRDVVDMFVLRAREKGLKLSFLSHNEALLKIKTDGQKVREVISNLVDNAIKYSEKGEITVVLERIEERVRISIKDEGIGIESEEIGYLFQKFARGKGMGQIHTNGTGLGLYVGKNLIEALGGSIYVSSQGRGKGSTFFVELPIYSSDTASHYMERSVFEKV